MPRANHMDGRTCKMELAAVGRRPTVPSNAHIPAAAPRPLVVCHIVHGLQRGGLERQLIHVVQNLPASEFQHIVVARDWDAAAAERAVEFGDHVTVIGDASAGADRDFARKLAGILESHRVDVLHVRGLTMLVDAVVAAEWAGGIPMVSSFHGFEDAAASIARGIRRKVLREALLRCDARWAVSRGAADAVATAFNLPKDAFEVIHNGVDTLRFRPSTDRAPVRVQLGVAPNEFLLLCVGNIKPVKGHDVLIDAFATVRPHATTKLALIGADHSDGEIVRRATETCGADRVRFVGPTADVLPWLQAADAFVLPSRFEGLSNALLEAMACEMPVIATAVGGNLDVVHAGDHGLLVPQEDAAALGTAIETLIVDRELCERLGRAARQRVITHFNAAAMLSAIADQYRAAAMRVESSPCEATRAEVAAV